MNLANMSVTSSESLGISPNNSPKVVLVSTGLSKSINSIVSFSGTYVPYSIL